MMKFRLVWLSLFAALASCTLFKSTDLVPESEDVSQDRSDVSLDVSEDIGEDDLSNAMDSGSKDAMADGDMTECPVDAECQPGETAACENTGEFDRGLATCEACVWEQSECGTCDFFWAEDGDDDAAGSRAAPFATLSKLDEMSQEAGAQTTYCMQRGSTFRTDVGVRIARGRLTITDYGDSASDKPTVTGVIYPVSESNSTRSHQFEGRTDTLFAWGDDTLFAQEELGSLQYDETVSANVFSPEPVVAEVTVSSDASFRIIPQTTQNLLVLENLRFERVGKAIAIAPNGGDLDLVTIKGLEFDQVFAAVQINAGPVFTNVESVVMTELSATRFANGIVVGGSAVAKPDIVIEHSHFSQPYIIPTLMGTSAVALDQDGYAIVRNNVIDFRGFTGVGINFRGRRVFAGNEGSYDPPDGGVAFNNIILGGREAIVVSENANEMVFVYNNLIDGPRTGISIRSGGVGGEFSHNTILGVASIGLDLNLGTMMLPYRFTHNIIQMEGGTAIRYPLDPTLNSATIDDNAFFAGTIGGYDSLLAWRAATGFDLNSDVVDQVVFRDERVVAEDFIATSDPNLSAETPAENVATDYFGEERSAENPTRGAIEQFREAQ